MELMKKHKLNYTTSQEVYESDSSRYHVKECYTNIWNVMTIHMHKFHVGMWKIAYGYISSIQNLLVRHCFIIDENGLIVDPTLFTTRISDREKIDYYVMYEFPNLNEYFDAIEFEGGYPALDRYLKEYTKQATEWGLKNGFVLVG